MSIFTIAAALQEIEKTFFATSALEALRDQQAAIDAVFNEYAKQRSFFASLAGEHAKQQKALLEMAKIYHSDHFCLSNDDIAKMFAPVPTPRMEYMVEPRFRVPTFAADRDFEDEDEPNPRSIVRPEVKTKIGFRR